MQQPHKIKSTWKCGGVKISEVVKKMYKAESGDVGGSRPESQGGDGTETKTTDSNFSDNWLPNSQGMDSKEGHATNALSKVHTNLMHSSRAGGRRIFLFRARVVLSHVTQ
jgi:hypothetical protein